MGRYSYRKSYTWDPGTAYLTGLIASDGCLAKDGRHIILTSKDIEPVRSAQMILGRNTLPRLKTGQFGTTAYHFQFSDVALYDFLYKSGITPAKSRTIQSVGVPDIYYADFLRGYFDGDGTVYGFKDQRWPSSYMYYVGFACASYEFMIWLQDKNRQLLLCKRGSIRSGKRAYILSYAKADSQLLFRAMYHNPSACRLTRKYDKFLNFITSDPYVKISVDARVLESVDRHV